jgi:hypothetical protein
LERVAVIGREPLWESATKSYVRAALEMAEWDFGLGLVNLPELDEGPNPCCHACRTLAELRDYLFEIARIGWNACAPREGDHAFEELDVGSVIDQELAVHRVTIERIGWTLGPTKAAAAA